MIFHYALKISWLPQTNAYAWKEQSLLKKVHLEGLRKTNGKMVFTCGIILSLPRRSWSPIVDMSIPSIRILPPDLSTILNRQFDSVDLPAPVRPTIPIYNEIIIKGLYYTFCQGRGLCTDNKYTTCRYFKYIPWSVRSNFTSQNNLDCHGRRNVIFKDRLYSDTPYSLERLGLICMFPLVLSNLVTT